MDTDTIETAHPSFGQISISRVSSSKGAPMYGSKLRHTRYITLKIGNSRLCRNLSRDWYFFDKELISVRMSENQFAQLITSLNSGSGTPCTIEHVNCQRVEDTPFAVETDTMKKEFETTAKDVAANLAEAKRMVRELSAPGGKLTKSAINELKEAIDRAQSAIASSMPFVVKQFEEAMDNIVTSAKADIEAYTSESLMRLGVVQTEPVVRIEEAIHEVS